MLKAVIIIFAWFFLFNVIYAIIKPKEEYTPPKTIMTFSEKRDYIIKMNILKQQVKDMQEEINRKQLRKDIRKHNIQSIKPCH